MGRNRKLSVLIGDDDAFMREFICEILHTAGYDTKPCSDGSETIQALGKGFDAILLDLSMPKASGLEVLSVARTKCPRVPVIVVSGTGEVNDAVAALKFGASDYISKPFTAEELLARLGEVLKRRSLEEENRELRSAFVAGPRIELVADSDSGQELLERARRTAQVDSTALITGPSGTGKSALAQWIHQNGQRASFPFVCVSCGALPRELIESELFGHEKGAFTGADASRAGRFESANGGTLFLDEIGELPLDLQPKLLNVLQDRSVTRLGSSEARALDVRVIAATNRDLGIAVEEGAFREDLYYRLNVLHLDVPSLAERRGDIEPIVHQKLRKITDRLGMGSVQISAEAIERLVGHDWPGNVRELENVLERAVVFAQGGVIEVGDLGHLRARVKASSTLSLTGFTLAELERQAIEQTLEAVNGTRSEAASLLGVSERTIYNRLKEYGIEDHQS